MWKPIGVNIVCQLNHNPIITSNTRFILYIGLILRILLSTNITPNKVINTYNIFGVN